MNDQQAYEGVRAWIARDGAAKAYDPGFSQCMYRTTDGNRCAIGGLLHLAGVSEDSPIWHSEAAIDDILEDDEVADEVYELLHGVNLKMLIEFQAAHDAADDERGNVRWQTDVLERLDWVAAQYDLKVVTT